MRESNSTNFQRMLAIGLQAARLMSRAAISRIAPASLVAVLGLGGVSWVIESAIAPNIATAYTARSNVAINRQPGESYETMLRRAEAIARAAAQRSFDRDILVTDVAVTVLAQNQEGAIAPIMALQVSRQAWRSRPDPQSWAKYFPNAKSLLKFEETIASPGGQPATPTAPAQPPATTTPPPGQAPARNRGAEPLVPVAPLPQPSGNTLPNLPPGNANPGQQPGNGNANPGQQPGNGNANPGQQPGNASPGQTSPPAGQQSPGQGSSPPAGQQSPGQGSSPPAGQQSPGQGSSPPAGQQPAQLPGTSNTLPSSSR
ncbi:hypothetical protein H6F77_01505 [Microcoleus sp. FACHB-831]|uniref:hypothetical protein n=1 Tax=Microcoleus sp. FACHB-831 TaxID=2692827 RepID=UPI0016854B82|nr:hypothetical protein [Microcoleus sp. FACHB-831]MBD1919796.1 hypothetical protein [Microcoleus sp. FACHB-831]